MARGALLVATVLLVSLTTATAGFSLTLGNAIAVPDRQVTFEDETFTISTISQFSQGETITVETTGPTDDAYRVYVYGVDDGSRRLIDTKHVAGGDGSVTFDTDAYTPGSYVAAIYNDGTFYDPQPFVIAGYDLSVSLSDQRAAPGSSVTVTVTVTPTASSGDPASVEVVVASDDRVTRLTASKRNNGYTTTVSLDGYEPGTYRVYAVAHSNEDAPGGSTEIIALTHATTLSVSTRTTTSDAPPGGESTTTTPTTTTTDPTTTTTGSTTTVSTTPSSETTTSTHQQSSTRPPTSSHSTTSTQATRTTGVSTTDTVVTPNSTTETTTAQTPNTTPWLLGVVVAIGVIGLRLRERR